MSEVRLLSKSKKKYLATNSNDVANSVSKLRRLKIQEELLAKSIKTSLTEVDLEEEQFFDNVFSQTTSKNIVQINNSYNEIRNLFQEVKINANSEDADIDEIKKGIKNLEIKIKTQNVALDSQLAALRKSEMHICQQLNQYKPENNIQTNKKKKLKTFDDIVPSPVKNMINLPLKNIEIQEFQDFISSNKRHGGWIEYQHNIFERLWKKHLHHIEDFENNIFESPAFEKFLRDTLANIQGINSEQIKEHSKWYLTYLTLKNRQAIALNEWRIKRNTQKHTKYRENEKSRIQQPSKKHEKKTQSKNIYYSISDESVSPEYIEKGNRNSCSSSVTSNCSELTGHSSNSGYMRSTKQWDNKCNTFEEINKWKQICNLNNIGRLKVPDWRAAT